MRKLVAFENLTLDGFFADAGGGLNWAYEGADDPEFSAFVAENAGSGGLLVLGRITYEMMAGYWPTPAATRNDPVVAEHMNSLPKLVFSRTLSQASWSNTTLVKGDIAAEIRRRKREPGSGMAILGSGSIVSQLAQEGVIDNYQFVVNPVVLGKGRPMFEGLSDQLRLQLTSSRAFANGKVFLSYDVGNRERSA